LKAHTLVAAAQDAQTSGDITAESPVFAVVRDAMQPIDSPEAWHAVSVIQVELNADDGSIVCVADSRDDAVDMSMAAFVARTRELSRVGPQQDLLVALRGGADLLHEGADDALEVVDVYADEHGLGLMVWFEGYEKWRASDT
jgi:hypothetical protein